MILKKIEESAALYPDKTAIQFKSGETYQKHTYSDLIKNVYATGSGLARLGIQKGDRVALLSENRPEWVFAYLGVVSSGAVVVPMDAQLMEKDIAVLLADSEAKAVFVSGTTRSKLPLSDGFKVISFDPGPGLSFGEMLSSNQAASMPAPPDAHDLAAILYTSGTTGDPKGVMLTHGNLASNCEGIIKLELVDHLDNLLCILPLHHTYPAMVCMLLPLSVGATVTILNSLKGPDLLACMQETGVTIVIGVPQLFAGLRRAIFDEIRKKPLPVRLIVRLLMAVNSLLIKTAGVNIGKAIFGQVHARFGPNFRLFASGGARLEPDVQTDMNGLGFVIIEGYGLTETSPVCTFNPLHRQKPGSIGVPLPGVDVRIADPDETGMGEIVVRGPNVMAGYFKKPDETEKVLRDGWLYTGDLAYRDRDGYFFITGRSKEMIVLSTGKKIFPDEIEAFYKQIPAIKEICVVDTVRGIEAAVVPNFDYLRKMNLSNSREVIASEIEDLSRSLPPYKRIRGLKIFKESLPVTRLGKLRRSLVKKLYLTAEDKVERPATEEDRELLSDELGRRIVSYLEPFSAKKGIHLDDNLELDLGLDSLARVEMVVALEKGFGVRLPDSFGSEVFTVRDVISRIKEAISSEGELGTEEVKRSWAEILKVEPSPDVLRGIRLESGRVLDAAKRLVKIALNAVYVLYGRMSVSGIENLPEKGPYIIAPNHLSYVDAPLVVAAMPWRIVSQTFFLGHTRYFGGRLTSRLARFIHVIPVDMDTRLQSALYLSAHVLRHGKILCVFPEGTRSRDGRLKEFKKGVGILSKELGVPIVPAAISGTYEMMPPGAAFPRPVRVHISFGRPISPNGKSYEDIVNALRDEVARMQQAAKPI